MHGQAILEPLAGILISQEAIGHLNPSGAKANPARPRARNTGPARTGSAKGSRARAEHRRCAGMGSCHSGERLRSPSRLPTRYVQLKGMAVEFAYRCPSCGPRACTVPKGRHLGS
jgi:hypothetical protein